MAGTPASSHGVSSGANTFTGNQTAPAFAASGLTGATAASRYAGATASGAPGSGTFAAGDFVADQTGAFWLCTVAGSPGTWTQVGGGGTWTNYTPTVVGTTSNSLTRARYFLIGKLCLLAFELEGTGSTTSYTMTLPFTAGSTIDFYDHFHGRNAGTWINGMAEITTSSAIVTFYVDDAFTAWTASGDRRAWGEIFYETV